MADAESLREVAHSRAPLSTWLGIVLLFALFGVIVLAVIGPAPRGSNYEEARARKRADALKAARDEAAKALTTYGWIDKNKGIAHVPIERAMELTIAELARQKPAPAGLVATPSAAPSPSPQPSGTPKPTSVARPGSESRGQPAAAVNPAPAPPGTQPGASASPNTSPASSAAQPNPAGPTSSPLPAASPAGSPSPVPGKTP